MSSIKFVVLRPFNNVDPNAGILSFKVLTTCCHVGHQAQSLISYGVTGGLLLVEQLAA